MRGSNFPELCGGFEEEGMGEVAAELALLGIEFFGEQPGRTAHDGSAQQKRAFGLSEMTGSGEVAAGCRANGGFR